jgi:NAD-dependent deacetylase
MVPELDNAQKIAAQADVFIIVGTSLNVYPAAGLVHNAPDGCPIFLVDPNEVNDTGIRNLVVLRETAGKGVPLLVEQLLNGELIKI